MMSTDWTTIAAAELEDADLVLQQRGDDFLIWFDGRVLMNSFSRGSEEQLSSLALSALPSRTAPRILIGGLGMGFTLRAALDAMPAEGRVAVAELNQVIVDWCEGPLATATSHATADPRVTLIIDDVAAVIAAAAPASLDAIILDLYEGPFDELQGRTDPFYSAMAIATQRQALAPGGVLAVWAEAADPPYAERLAAAGFRVATHPIPSGDECHVVYVARRTEQAPLVRERAGIAITRTRVGRAAERGLAAEVGARRHLARLAPAVVGPRGGTLDLVQVRFRLARAPIDLSHGDLGRVELARLDRPPHDDDELFDRSLRPSVVVHVECSPPSGASTAQPPSTPTITNAIRITRPPPIK